MINISKYLTGNLLESIIKIKMMEKEISLIGRFNKSLPFLQSKEAAVHRYSIISQNSMENS